MKIRKTVTAVLAGSFAWATAAYAAPVQKRAHAAGRFMLQLGKNDCGWIQSVEGGHASSDVVTEKIGGDHLQKKHIGNVRYSDVTLVTTESGMCAGFYGWLQRSFSHNQAGKGRQNGAIVQLDATGTVVSRLTFTNALVTEVGMPALDAASKDAAKMTLKFKPETTRKVVGSAVRAFKIDAKKQKQWLPSNFRLEVAGINASRVNKIEGLTVKQTTATDAVGQERDYAKEPGKLEFPALKFSVPEAYAKPLLSWHKATLKATQKRPLTKNGRLRYLGAGGKVLFTLPLRNLGLRKVTPSNRDRIRRVNFEMYVENIVAKMR